MPIAKGIITNLYGTSASIPAGWQICDGTNDTPDLRDFFVCGASSSADVTSGSGGQINHSHTVPSLNSGGTGEGHTVSGTSAENPSSAGASAGSNNPYDAAPDHTHRFSSITSGHNTHTHTITGYSDTYSSLLPYYKLFYIMKL